MNYIGHLAFGIKALNILKKHNPSINEETFLTGCLAPDIARTDAFPKSVTHFRDNSPNLYKSPDLDKFLNKYGDRLHEDFVLGYYCHLYADKVFTDIFLFEAVTPLDKNYNPTCLQEKSVYIKNRKTNDIVDIRDKAKSTHLYSDYLKTTDFVGSYFNVPYKINFFVGNPNMDEIDYLKLGSMQDICSKYYNENTESIFSGDSETKFLDLDNYIRFISDQSENFANEVSNIFSISTSDFKSII